MKKSNIIKSLVIGILVAVIGIVSYVSMVTAAGGDITYGSEAIFESTATTSVSSAMLDSTHVVVAYQNGDTYGSAVVGSISGDTITWVTPVVFNSTGTNNISVAALDSTHFVVTYRDYGGAAYGGARIGEVSGTTISSYGAENLFNSASTSYTSVSALDSTHFVVAYQDNGNLSYGTAIVGTTSGTTISSYGAENVFKEENSSYISVEALDSTHFVVAYRDNGGTTYGNAIVGLVSGTTISSYGAENTFNSASTYWISVATLDSTHFVVAYHDFGGDDYGRAIVGLVSGTTISSYGSQNTFNSINTVDISVAALDSTHFVVTYKDEGGDDYGGAKAGTTSGTTISSYGSEAIFNSAITKWTSVSALNSTDFVIAYEDDGGDDYGIGIFGSIAEEASTDTGFFLMF